MAKVKNRRPEIRVRLDSDLKQDIDKFQGRDRPTIDFAAIAREAIPALRAVLSRVLPGGRVIGREYVALNPCRADRHSGSFKVCVAGGRAGMWADFATGDKGGDVISLVAYVENIRQVEAARLVAQMLGINVAGRRHG